MRAQTTDPESEAMRQSGGTPTTRPSSERGSAMIIALMIMIILTLLGVTFLVLAEQEQQISVNERDYAQALYVAEAAVEVAKTWFNDPSSGNPFLVPSAQVNRNLRQGQTFLETYTNADERGASPGLNVNANTSEGGSADDRYVGGNAVLFDKPFRGPTNWGFWGRRDAPDVLICDTDEFVDLDGDTTTDCQSTTWIDNLNATLADLISTEHDARGLGLIEIEQIRVYRPPLDYNLRIRYGVATIEAIAVKKLAGGRVVTARSVRDVVQEIPFPGPGGAIETEADVGQAGSAGVHWGPVVSAALSGEDDINLQSGKFEVSVPRDRSDRWGYHHTINAASFHALEENGADNATALTELLGSTRNGNSLNNADPIHVEDPWIVFRARNSININGTPLLTDCGGDTNQPYPYGWRGHLDKTVNNQGGYATADSCGNGYRNNFTNLFQGQIVRFPPILYDTWKEVVRSGQEGMHLLVYTPGTDPPEWRLNGTGDSKVLDLWVDRAEGAVPGVYFFDTKNGGPPCDDCFEGGSNLTPTAEWGQSVYMEGFALIYAEQFNGGGSGTETQVDVAMPGEIFLDDGIDLHDGGTTAGHPDDCICIRVDSSDGTCILGLRPIGYDGCGPEAWSGDACNCDYDTLQAIPEDIARREADTFRNGVWDSDLDDNGYSEEGAPQDAGDSFDDFVTTVETSDHEMSGHGYAEYMLPHYPYNRRLRQGDNSNDWVRDPRFLNHNDESPLNCATCLRQPHEPFLNFEYPGTASSPEIGWSSSAGENGVTVDYRATGDANECSYADYDPDARTHLCDAYTGFTTRAHDSTGGLFRLGLHVNGVVFCEGLYDATGNMKVYGSMMMKGGYTGQGSLEVWFNEGLIKGDFPPVEWKLPRIFTSARDHE